MSIRCPNCGYPNFANSTTCRRCKKLLPLVCPACNAPLREEAAFCSACGEQFELKKGPDGKIYPVPIKEEARFVGRKPRELKNCDTCGRKIAKDSIFCTYCGHRFDSVFNQDEEVLAEMPVEEYEAPEPEPPQKRKKPVAPPAETKAFPTAKVAPVQVPKPKYTPEAPIGAPAIPQPKPSGSKPAPKPKVKPPAPSPVPKPMPTGPEPEPEPPPVETETIEPIEEIVAPQPEEIKTPPVDEPIAAAPKPEPEPGELDEEAERSREGEEEAARLRATHIGIKESVRAPIKLMPLIDQPIYIEHEFAYRPPNYPQGDVDAGAIQPPEGMSLIEGGRFLYGADQTENDLQPFFMDIFPVTCVQYLEFCEATRHPKPWDWANGCFLPGKDKHPVTFVNRNNARAYAQWAGKRLPSEIEWEKAAGGTDGRLYPWGNEFKPDHCLCQIEHKTKLTAPVDTYPDGASPFGCMDMVGNVAEWTEAANASAGKNGIAILRGGSLADRCEMTTCRIRMITDNHEWVSPFIGFRCAKDIEI